MDLYVDFNVAKKGNEKDSSNDVDRNKNIQVRFFDRAKMLCLAILKYNSN